MFARLAEALEARAARPAEPNALERSGRASSLCCAAWRGHRARCPMAVCCPAGTGLSPVVSAQEHCLTSDVARRSHQRGDRAARPTG